MAEMKRTLKDSGPRMNGAQMPKMSTPLVRLLHDEVVVRLIAPEQHSHGLWIPETAKRTAGELWRGTVIAVGPGARTPKKGLRIVPDVKAGDMVGFYWMAGKVNTTKWPNDDCRVIHEEDIQVIYEPEPEAA